jgi:DnaJ like chaperone protein
MSIWSGLVELLSSALVTASGAMSAVVEAVRTTFEGDPATRRRVAFSVAMIALSAKMAKADGVVTEPEIAAFFQIFEVEDKDRVFVERLHQLARQDIAGFEAYAGKLASLFENDDGKAPLLEDVLDGLFHIAKSDGVVHERELGFLLEVATIFGFSEQQFDLHLARHAIAGRVDPYKVLGISTNTSMAEARSAWLRLVKEHHPDAAIARGMPDEFVAIANARLAAINAAWEQIEREKKAA